MYRFMLIFLLALPFGANAQDKSQVVADVVDNHVLPRFAALAQEAGELQAAAGTTCDPASDDLRSAFGSAFDAWILASHLRFGPTETLNRGFSLSFWPDTRGRIGKTLNAMIGSADPAVDDPDEFATVSVAGKGFYALEFLLHDPAYVGHEETDYVCRLVRAIAFDISLTSSAILDEWTAAHAELMRKPSPEGPYRDEDEVLRTLFTALNTGLETTSSARLGRPLGTVQRPRPKRAEARRSKRSLRHVQLSLESLHDLGMRLAKFSGADAPALDDAFQVAITQSGRIGSDDLSNVSDPEGRSRVEALRLQVEGARVVAIERVATALGVAAGFNVLDGD